MKKATGQLLEKGAQGDYGIEAIVTVEDVRQIEQAREFLAERRRHLGVQE